MYIEEPKETEKALVAIKSLIEGEYDNVDLMDFGDLHPDKEKNILNIIDKTL